MAGEEGNLQKDKTTRQWQNEEDTSGPETVHVHMNAAVSS
jgi:hypothetical protein